MYSQINQQIEDAVQGIQRLRKIDSMLDELKNESLSMERKVFEQKAVMDKEDVDVRNLENKSLAKIFYLVLGNLEERVDKERREAFAARLKYDQVVRDLSGVKRKISSFSSERVNYIDCSSTYNRLYDQKKELLIKSNPETAQKILDITEKLNISKNKLKEITEAIEVGRDAMNSINHVQSSLGSAESWGVYDLIGGGLMTDLIKHSHIDDAKSEVQETQSLLRRFKTELTDININSDITIETEGFAKFADFFFDGLISDWFMQSRIENSQECVLQVSRQVQNVLDELERLEEHESSRIEKFDVEVNNLIIKG